MIAIFNSADMVFFFLCVDDCFQMLMRMIVERSETMVERTSQSFLLKYGLRLRTDGLLPSMKRDPDLLPSDSRIPVSWIPIGCSRGLAQTSVAKAWDSFAPEHRSMLLLTAPAKYAHSIVAILGSKNCLCITIWTIIMAVSGDGVRCE